MIDIKFLGTGCMQPTKQRNHAAVLLSYKKENILFDCGEGTQRQMRISGVKPAKITRLCISHWHGDHVFGIPGLLSSMGADQYVEKLEIYGPKGSRRFLEHMLKGFAAKDIIPHKVYEISKGKVFENDDFELIASPMKHTTTCIGFAFVEKNRRRVDVQKAKKLSLEGPILGTLQQGKAVIVKGKKIKPDDVTYEVQGKKICYITDTALCDGLYSLAEGADLLILEGTLLDSLRKKAEKVGHLTVKQAALVASESNVAKLIITHISQRYKTTDELVTEARGCFDNTIIAEDFMNVQV